MQSHDEIAVPVSPEEVTLYVAIELSVKSWVILTIRMQVRRFTRLTNGFSKRVTNHALMVATYFTFTISSGFTRHCESLPPWRLA